MGAALAILAAAQTALDRISDMRTLAGALEVNADVPLLVLLTSSSCADCRFLATGFGEAASLAPRARFATAVEENDISTSFGVTGVPHVLIFRGDSVWELAADALAVAHRNRDNPSIRSWRLPASHKEARLFAESLAGRVSKWLDAGGAPVGAPWGNFTRALQSCETPEAPALPVVTAENASATLAGAPLALLLLHDPTRRGDLELRRALRRAAATLAARGLDVPIVRAEISDGAGISTPSWRRALQPLLTRWELDDATASAAPLPRIALIRGGAWHDWATGVAEHDFVDVVAALSSSSVVPAASEGPLLRINDAASFERECRDRPLLLAAFTVRWCARCTAIADALERGAAALAARDDAPAMRGAAIALVDMDAPAMAPLITRLRVFAFPVGLYFSYSADAPIATYTRGPTADDVVADVLARWAALSAAFGARSCLNCTH